MKRTIDVHVGDAAVPVGTLRYDQQGARESASFEYASSWLASPNRFAIEPNLPLVSGPQFHRRSKDGSALHAPFADTEPDGWGRRVILRDHAKRRRDQRSGEGRSARGSDARRSPSRPRGTGDVGPNRSDLRTAELRPTARSAPITSISLDLVGGTSGATGEPWIVALGLRP